MEACIDTITEKHDEEMSSTEAKIVIVSLTKQLRNSKDTVEKLEIDLAEAIDEIDVGINVFDLPSVLLF